MPVVGKDALGPSQLSEGGCRRGKPMQGGEARGEQAVVERAADPRRAFAEPPAATWGAVPPSGTGVLDKYADAAEWETEGLVDTVGDGEGAVR